MFKKMIWKLQEKFVLKLFEEIGVSSFMMGATKVDVRYDDDGKFDCFVIEEDDDNFIEDDFTEDNFVSYDLADTVRGNEYTPTYLYKVVFKFDSPDDEPQVYDLFVEAFNEEDAEILVQEDLMLKGFDGYTIVSVTEYKNFMPYFNTPPIEYRGWK